MARIDPNKLAPTYPESAITRPFPFNGYYPESEAPEVDCKDYKLEVGGLIDNKEPWTLERLYALPQVSQITRHVCVEGWSAIGSWQGVRLSEFLERLGADTRAEYVWFQCAEGYSNTIDMATALHPQTQLHLWQHASHLHVLLCGRAVADKLEDFYTSVAAAAAQEAPAANGNGAVAEKGKEKKEKKSKHTKASS